VTAANILIVEDNRLTALDLTEWLTDLGYNILATASTGEEAVRLIEQMRPDIVLMDINLGGGIDGIEAAARMRPELLIPVIYLTAYAETAVLERAAVTGPYGYLIKPISERELHSTIQMALARRKIDAALIQAHRDLKESREGFRDLFQNNPLPTWIVDHKTLRFLDVNEAAILHYGFSREEFLAMSVVDIHPPENERPLLEIFDPLGPSFRRVRNWRHRRKDGSLIEVDVFSHSCMRDGVPVRLTVAIDITERNAMERERQRAADELREKDRRLSDMLGNVDLIAIMLDRDACITYCNDYLLTLTGWHREEVIGKSWLELFVSPEEENRLRGTFSDLLKNLPQVWHHENKIVTKSGARRLIHWNNSLLHSTSQEVIGTASIGEDITERQLGIEKISRLNEISTRALVAAQAANEAKRLFLANMSHELRTPLNAIIGFSGILCGESFGPLGNTKYIEYSHDILDSGRHLLGLIQTILDVVRFEGGDIPLGEGPESLRDAARWAVALLQDKIADREINLSMEIDDRCPLIRMDSLHLRQLMINLIGNAVKFSKPGGKVKVKAKLISEDVVLRISDNGVGVPPDAIDKVFIPFNQVDEGYARKSDGVGLGLSICKSIAEAYGGSINLASEPGVQTTVSVVFPCTRLLIDFKPPKGDDTAGFSPAVH
jgi:PAS domain S-box-containing protein